MGSYEFQVPPGQTIVAAASLIDHGGTELPLDLTANNLEPRADGVVKIEFTVTGPVASVSASVSCVNSTYTGLVTTTPAGSTVTVEFAPALANQDACEVTLTGDAADVFCVRTLAGDVDRNGTVATTDASLIKPHYGLSAAAAGPEFDYDTSGTIAVTDFSLIKPKYSQTAAMCP